MKFKIVYDKPQRIRFRCGAYAFDKEYEGAIYNLVTASPYVNSAQVSSANGGILVNYTKGSRSKIIDLVRAINVKTLKKNEPSAEFHSCCKALSFKDVPSCSDKNGNHSLQKCKIY